MKTLGQAVTGWVYEIPQYKYDAIFRPLDEMLKKEPEAKSAKDLLKKK